MGIVPERNQHQCLDELGRTIQHKRINHVVEADIKSFFDQVNHQWMVKFLRHRIGDERVIRLIIRMLKSGIMEDGSGEGQRARNAARVDPCHRCCQTSTYIT